MICLPDPFWMASVGGLQTRSSPQAKHLLGELEFLNGKRRAHPACAVDRRYPLSSSARWPGHFPVLLCRRARKSRKDSSPVNRYPRAFDSTVCIAASKSWRFSRTSWVCRTHGRFHRNRPCRDRKSLQPRAKPGRRTRTRVALAVQSRLRLHRTPVGKGKSISDTVPRAEEGSL